MTDPAYTETDVRAIAVVLAAGWTPPADPDAIQFIDDARAVLDHLAAAGRLQPPEVEQPQHLAVETSARGFDRLPPIPSACGGGARVYESSAASGPHVWLAVESLVDRNDRSGPTYTAHLHLTAESAWQLSEQLRWLVEHHYQGDARPGVELDENTPEGKRRG